jgi:HEAT repeat protein
MGTRVVWLFLAGLAASALAAEGEAPKAEPAEGEGYHRVIEAIDRLKLPDREDRLRALQTIQRFPDKAVRPLVLAARSDDAVFRARIANALGLVGKGDRDALFALTTMLKDPDPFVRREALAALVKAGDASHAAVIQPLVDDRVEAVRTAAVAALGQIEPAAAIQRMTALLQHKDARVRRTALAELVARKAPNLDALLAERLKDADPGVRGDAAAALAKGKGPEAASLFLALLDDKDAYVRVAALSALKNLKAAQAVPRLVTLLNDPDESVRAEAISALSLLDADRVSVAPLIGQLTATSRRLRERAAFALGLLGRPRGKDDAKAALARKAVPALIPLLGDEAPDVREKAHLALRMILGANVKFSPEGSVEERQKAMAEWQGVWQKAGGK